MKPQAPQSIDFEFPPPAGTVVMFHGQRYEMAGTEPYTRKDGSLATLLRWRSHCARCAEPMEVKTLPVSKGVSRRCPECAAPGVKA